MNKLMEEIDIIELLKRVKEGKAPKRIEIYNDEYTLITGYGNLTDITTLYRNEADNCWLYIEGIGLDTKIKILDKPIIEECDEIDLQCFKDDEYVKTVIRTNRKKINEIIKWINKENKDE